MVEWGKEEVDSLPQSCPGLAAVLLLGREVSQTGNFDGNRRVGIPLTHKVCSQL